MLIAATEVCVDAFMAGDLDFLGIVDTVADVVDAHLADPATAEGELSVDRVLSADAQARETARATIAARKEPPAR